ncbi:hypothetical protein GCM10010172_44020 [Paractinoplanes ferrugineus]|uniref:Uncharacterized protein n=1 Tax=Paractinoplanes ferrugineus TaxID=113564 RepID=A0A919MID3_9ACTN|nr:hypothetical protein Afe05nite_54000 [Actinoplanes ferrugineus]
MDKGAQETYLSTSQANRDAAANWALSHVGEKYSYNFATNRRTSCYGKTLASGADDNTVRLWGVNGPSSAQMIQHICASVGHDIGSNDSTTYSLGENTAPICIS